MAKGELLGTVILAGNCRGSAIIGWGCGEITQGTIIRERRGAIFFAGNCPRTVYNQHGRQIFIYLFEAVIIIEKAVSVIFQNSCFSIFSGKHLSQSLLFCKYSSRLVTSAYFFKKRCSDTGAFLN